MRSNNYRKSSHSRLSPANAAGLPHENRAMTLRFIARLPQERQEQYEVRTIVAQLYLRQSFNFASTSDDSPAYHRNARQSCEHRTAALRLVKITFWYAILSAICRKAWRLR